MLPLQPVIEMIPEPPISSTELPLRVDLDGALVRTDTLVESLLLLLKANPLWVFVLPVWLWRGKANLKRQIAARVALDPATLPYDTALLEYLRRERETGRSLVLVSAADERVARVVSEHLEIFDEIIASDGTFDLKGSKKRGVLVERVRPTFTPRSSRLRAVLRALRPQQWVKNLLVFVPLLLAPEARNLSLLLDALVAFVAFSLCASSVYVANDLLDLDADRRHESKRHRPFAAGDLPLALGFVLGPVSLAIGVAFALMLPPTFLAVLLVYLVTTTAYSLRLKHVPLIDVIVLAVLYTGRVLAGAAATLVWPSPWILGFSLFFFLSLAFVKRYSELHALRQRQEGASNVRGYLAGDLDLIATTGTASGYISVLVVALYINSDRVAGVYSQPAFLWMVCPLLLYWISRVWLLAHRGQMQDDPVMFAVRDRTSYAVGALLAAVLVSARLG